jgi:hypothetical protein
MQAAPLPPAFAALTRRQAEFPPAPQIGGRKRRFSSLLAPAQNSSAAVLSEIRDENLLLQAADLSREHIDPRYYSSAPKRARKA